ncbi:MAG: hypothetical protein D6772_06190, partial [Bacteroidetes bacterium]
MMVVLLAGAGLTAAAQPANDLCVNAIPIAEVSTTIGTTTGATTTDDPTAFCGTSVTAPGVWYVVTPSADGLMTAETCEPSVTNYDTKLSVYTGGCGVFNCVTGNDDNCPGFRSAVTFDVIAGTDYYIFVHGFGSATGDFQLDVNLVLPFYTVLEGDQCLAQFIDISATGTALNLADDGTATVQMPFDFNYFGVDYTGPIDMEIDNNGNVNFANNGDQGGFTNEALPSNDFTDGGGTTGNGICPFWDDLDSETGNVYWEVQGAAPARLFIVQWDMRPHFPGPGMGSGTVQLQIDEFTGNISFLYPDVDFGDAAFNGGASATIGIQGEDVNGDLVAQQYSFNEAAVSDGDCITYAVVIPEPDPCEGFDEFNYGCITNLNVTLQEDCMAKITPQMVITGDNEFTCVDSIAINVNGTPADVIIGCGNHTYEVTLFDVSARGEVETLYTCWGNVFTEDKTAPVIECPVRAGTGTADIPMTMQMASGTLENTDPTVVLTDYACFSDAFEPADGDRPYDLITFTVSG